MCIPSSPVIHPPWSFQDKSDLLLPHFNHSVLRINPSPYITQSGTCHFLVPSWSSLPHPPHSGLLGLPPIVPTLPSLSQRRAVVLLFFSAWNMMTLDIGIASSLLKFRSWFKPSSRRGLSWPLGCIAASLPSYCCLYHDPIPFSL